MPASLTKLHERLHGVEFFDPQRHSEVPQQLVRLLQFQDSPASYILGMALEEFAGQKLPDGEKIAWKALLVFKGYLWYLHDWKHGSWTLDGPPDRDSVRDELLKKLHGAARYIEHRLKAQAKIKINNGDFALANLQFGRLYSYYIHLRKEAEKLLSLSIEKQPLTPVETLSDCLGSVTRLDTSAINDYFARWRAADAAAAGAVVLFFGLLEVLFDACFAFGDRKGLSYMEFKKKDWKERFKFVVDVKLPSAEKIYRELMRVQRRYRNVFVHATPTFFVFDDRLGRWIPENVDELREPQMNPIYAFDEERVRSTFAVFDETMAFFENHESTWAPTMYAKTPLPIPMAPERLAALKKHAGSRDDFETEIERRLYFFDAFINGEI